MRNYNILPLHFKKTEEQVVQMLDNNSFKNPMIISDDRRIFYFNPLTNDDLDIISFNNDIIKVGVAQSVTFESSPENSIDFVTLSFEIQYSDLGLSNDMETLTFHVESIKDVSTAVDGLDKYIENCASIKTVTDYDNENLNVSLKFPLSANIEDAIHFTATFNISFKEK